MPPFTFITEQNKRLREFYDAVDELEDFDFHTFFRYRVDCTKFQNPTEIRLFGYTVYDHNLRLCFEFLKKSSHY